jgi:hypothetical protein
LFRKIYQDCKGRLSREKEQIEVIDACYWMVRHGSVVERAKGTREFEIDWKSIAEAICEIAKRRMPSFIKKPSEFIEVFSVALQRVYREMMTSERYRPLACIIATRIKQSKLSFSRFLGNVPAPEKDKVLVAQWSVKQLKAVPMRGDTSVDLVVSEGALGALLSKSLKKPTSLVIPTIAELSESVSEDAEEDDWGLVMPAAPVRSSGAWDDARFELDFKSDTAKERVLDLASFAVVSGDEEYEAWLAGLEEQYA